MNTVQPDGNIMMTLNVNLPDRTQATFIMPTIPCDDLYSTSAWKTYFQQLVSRFTDPKITKALAVCSYLNRECFYPGRNDTQLTPATCDVQGTSGNEWLNLNCGSCLFKGNACGPYSDFFRQFFTIQTIFTQTVPQNQVNHENIRNFIQQLVKTVCGKDVDMAQLEKTLTNELILFIATLLGTAGQTSDTMSMYTKYAWIAWPTVSFAIIFILMIVLRLTK